MPPKKKAKTKISKKTKKAPETEPILDSALPAKTKYMPKISRPISIYKKIAISFIVLTLLLVSAVVYFSVVNVKIIIIPNKERTAASFIATVNSDDSNQENPGI